MVSLFLSLYKWVWAIVFWRGQQQSETGKALSQQVDEWTKHLLVDVLGDHGQQADAEDKFFQIGYRHANVYERETL